MRKNDAFVAKIVNTRLTKIFLAIFAPDERLPSSATLPDVNRVPSKAFQNQVTQIRVHQKKRLLWGFFCCKESIFLAKRSIFALSMSHIFCKLII